MAHVPPLILPEDVRREMNGGEDFTIVEGLHRMRRERIDPLDVDTIIVFDSHWFTTFDHIVTAHQRRTGRYTSDELPRGNPGMPYDLPGDPELARLIETVGGERPHGYVYACDDPYVGIHYPTVYLTPFLQGDEAWITIGVCQTATKDDFLEMGEIVGEAIRRSDRRVVLLASGALSHQFWPLKEIRDHEPADPAHIFSPAHRAADERVIELLEAGDHATVLAEYDEFRRFSPEGRFAPYLMMVAALGGAAFTGPGVPYSRYENAAGTGQIHLWFPT